MEKTTLKSLGLNSGKAILRLIYRDLDQLKTQAHVSMPLLPKLAVAVDDDRNCQRVPSSIPHCSKTIDAVTLSTNNVPNVEIQEKSGDATKMNVEKNEMEMNMEDHRMSMRYGSQEADTLTIEETHSVTPTQKDRNIEKNQNTMETCMKIQEDAYKIEFVRHSCMDVQSRKSGMFFSINIHFIIARREKCPGVRSS